MTANEKIKKLTGATAAVIDAETDRFHHFATLTNFQAASMLDFAEIGISANGELWCLNGRYRYIFADKSLAEIAKG